jgi:hypothetical protein
VPFANLRSLKQRVPWQGGISPYLPPFADESPNDYARRRLTSPLTNIYADSTANLASKPFSKTLDLDEKAGADLKKIAEDIDGQGNSLHVFAQEAFRKGIDYAIHWILVEYSRVPQGATLQQERDLGARPYWVSIPADRVIAVYSVFIGSKEHIYHARILEPTIVQEGFSEGELNRVRFFRRDVVRDDKGRVIAIGAPYWELWQEDVDQGSKKSTWSIVDAGQITLPYIPLVPFRTGNRHGTTWRLDPPMRDLAHMQIEEYQQESGLKHITEMAAFPMLQGKGVKPAQDANGEEVVVPVGPAAVLFAPPNNAGDHGEWAWIEPEAQSLVFLQSKLEKFQQEMRNLGKQPLAAANLTVVTTANVSMKASSAVQAWAILFKDALEIAWQYTCDWMKQKNYPSVNIHTDFGVDLAADKELTEIRELEKQGILSREDTAIEFKRRGVLRDDFDWEKNQERRASDDEGLEGEEEIDATTGKPIVRQNGSGKPAGAPTVN